MEPHIAGTGEYKGAIVIGKAKVNIHDLGKNIMVMLLKGSGYYVFDLGVDVPRKIFLRAIMAAGLDNKIVIGGNHVDKTDAYAETATVPRAPVMG